MEHLDLARLQALVTLAEELHFGRAAERLGVEVSTLSRRIHRLEDQLGVELFARSSRRVRLTSAGAAVTRQAERVLAEAEALRHTATEAARGRVGELRAAFSSSSTEPMARLQRELRGRLPELVVVAHRAPSPKIAEDVAFGHLSFGICQGGAWLATPALRHELIGSMPIDTVVLPLGHRLASTASVAADDRPHGGEGGVVVVDPPHQLVLGVGVGADQRSDHHVGSGVAVGGPSGADVHPEPAGDLVEEGRLLRRRRPPHRGGHAEHRGDVGQHRRGRPHQRLAVEVIGGDARLGRQPVAERQDHRIDG